MAELPVLTTGTQPPRSNGELVFAAPWEQRVFGLAVALHEAGVFGWPAFQSALIAQIARAEASGDFEYYRCWAGALEDVLADVVPAAELDERAQVLAGRPHGHDHG